MAEIWILRGKHELFPRFSYSDELQKLQWDDADKFIFLRFFLHLLKTGLNARLSRYT